MNLFSFLFKIQLSIERKFIPFLLSYSWARILGFMNWILTNMHFDNEMLLAKIGLFFCTKLIVLLYFFLCRICFFNNNNNLKHLILVTGVTLIVLRDVFKKKKIAVQWPPPHSDNRDILHFTIGDLFISWNGFRVDSIVIHSVRPQEWSEGFWSESVTLKILDW